MCLVVDTCLEILIQSICLQNDGAPDAGPKESGRISSALQCISAIETGQVKLPLITGSAISRLALFLMVRHVVNLL